MVRCPKGSASQVKANLAYIKKPSAFSIDSNCFSWVYDPVKGQMVCTGSKDTEVMGPESEGSELDSNKADKKCPLTPRDELTYFFIGCFLDILLKSWEGKPCLKPKLYHPIIPNELEEYGEDLGPCEVSTASSTADYLRDLYQKRMSNLSKEKLKKDSESAEEEYPNEEEFDSIETPVQWKPEADENVHFVFQNGVWYKGRVSRRLMEGEGTYFWEDGAAYQGKFEGGCVTGRGRLEFPDLSVYEGDVYKAFRHGEGMYCFSETQVMYSGQWWLGKKHGYGLIVYNDPTEGQNYYRGEWQDGVKEGFGFRQYPSGAKYIGFWSNGQRNGNGVMFWSNNDIYRGHWKNGLMHGFGEYTWNGFVNKTLSYPANNIYRGHWSKGKRNGLGIFEQKNGSLIETCWVENAKEGNGAVICENGAVIAAAPLFDKDKQALYRNQEDKTGYLLRDQAMKVQRRNEEQLLVYVGNLEKNKALTIPIHSPVHTLSVSMHTSKLFEQKAKILTKTENNKSQLTSVTPEPKVSEDRLPEPLMSDILTDLQCGRMKEISQCIVQEEKHLKNYIVLRLSALRRCYDHYATLACEKPNSVECVLLRIFLWQMLIDGGVPDANTSLVDVDDLLISKEFILLEHSHHPFEKIQFWQFLQILITLSWHFYGQYVYGELPLVEDKKLTDFLNYYENCECKSVLKAAFEYFIECDLFWGRFRSDDPPLCPSRENQFEESDLAPLEAMYTIYCNVGEPHSARDFVRALCGEKVEAGTTSTVRYYEKLPFFRIDGKNAFVAGELQHIPGPEPFNYPQILQLEGRETKAFPKAELTYFKELKAKRVIMCLIEVCPGILNDGCVANIDYKLTFLEFYKAIILCTKLKLKINAMNQMREGLIAAFRVQMEEYKKQLAEYDRLKDASVTSRKKSRQLSDVSKKGRK